MNVEIYPDYPVFDSTQTNAYPGLLQSYYNLLTAYTAAQTWADVVNLHTPASAAYIEQLGMKETWEAGPIGPWQATHSALVSLGDTSANAVLVTQSLPFSATAVDFDSSDQFSVFGARAARGAWLLDYTVQNTDLGRLMRKTRPATIKSAAQQWYLQRLALVTWTEVMDRAEDILGYDTAIQIISI